MWCFKCESGGGVSVEVVEELRYVDLIKFKILYNIN